MARQAPVIYFEGMRWRTTVSVKIIATHYCLLSLPMMVHKIGELIAM